MLTDLAGLSALSCTWLAALEEDDPELWEELAPEVIVRPAAVAYDQAAFPLADADLRATLDRFDLNGVRVGAFGLGLAPADSAAEALAAFDRTCRQQLEVDEGLIFVGPYGPHILAVAPGGVVLIDAEEAPRVTVLADRFSRFLLAQANACDASFRHLSGGRDDLTAYQAAAAACAADPAFAGADVAAIFDGQRFG